MEKAMSPHSSILAWKIPWMEEPGGLQFLESLGVGHDWAASLSLFTYTLEKEMATHSTVLAWRIPGTGEPGGLPSMGSQRVGHDWSNLAAAAADIYPLPPSLPPTTPTPFSLSSPPGPWSFTHVWDPMDCSSPGSVHRILQARILEWVTILFSRGLSSSRERTWVSCIASGLFTIWASKTKDFVAFCPDITPISYPNPYFLCFCSSVSPVTWAPNKYPVCTQGMEGSCGGAIQWCTGNPDEPQPAKSHVSFLHPLCSSPSH